MQNHEQCKEEMIELLTTVSEIMWSGGLLLLDMMHRGYLDELMTEDDEEYNKKVELLKRHKELFTGDLFGELTFIVITAKQNIEKLIGLFLRMRKILLWSFLRQRLSCMRIIIVHGK